MDKLADYEVLCVIGTGKFGTCYKVKNKLSNKIFVWKAIDYSDMDEDRRQQLISEIKILKQLSHPNIVKYFNHIVNKATHTLYIIMENCDGGDLAQMIRKCAQSQCHFEETFIWRVLYQLSKALQGCHSHKSTSTILHRDIKPANVFLDADGNIKLGDFGLARILSGTNNFAQSVVGTPYYMSPEIIKGGKYNRKSDIWSLGCLMYELCALVPPFSGRHMASLSRNITDGRFNRIPRYYSADLQKIIAFMLSVEHGYRPTIDIILHHPTVLMHIRDTPSSFPVLNSNSKTTDLLQQFSPNPILTSTSIASNPFDKNTTSDLRRELFQSPVADSKSLPFRQPSQICRTKFSNSDPEHYESPDKIVASKRSVSDCQTNQFSDPNEITQEIFNEALRQRLLAIKNKETILQRRESELNQREHAIMKREKQVKSMEIVPRISGNHALKRKGSSGGARKLIAHKANQMRYDDTIMSIEPNESVVMPTAAKINLNLFVPRQQPKMMERKVCFKSPPKLQNQENIAPPLPQRRTKFHTMKYTKDDLEKAVQNKCAISAGCQQMSIDDRSKSLSKISTGAASGKRKSFFGLFNINTNFDGRKSVTVEKMSVEEPKRSAPDVHLTTIEVDAKSQSVPDFQSKWTAEHKRTAFEMLAVMNATERNDGSSTNPGCQDESIVDDVVVNNKLFRHDRKRQSMVVLRCSRDNIHF